MARLRSNIIANYAGQAWMAFIAVVFVPFYIRALGIEAFGLVGFMLSLQAASQLLDFGLGGVVNRELARRAQNPASFAGARDLVRTFEFVIWPVSLLIGVGVWAASSAISSHWLHPNLLSEGETTKAIAIMALAIATLWPTSFYSNALSGMERQASLNVINAAFATLRGVGALLALTFLAPTISVFLWWYAVVGISHSLTLSWSLWRILPKSDTATCFRLSELMGARRFASGLFVITAISLAVAQFDRIALSALRPLEELGYYVVALSVSAALGRMVLPMFNALYPRFSGLIAGGRQCELSDLYHLSSQILAVVVAAVSSVLILFAKDVIYLWTGDPSLAARVALPMALLVAGTALNGLMNLPYALQLAYGWTRLTVASNLAALVLAIPIGLWAIASFGMVGAATVWLSINLGYVCISLPLMHRKLLRGELASWWFRDVFPPFIAATAITLVARYFLPQISRDLAGFAILATVSAVVLFASAFASQRARLIVLQIVSRGSPE